MFAAFMAKYPFIKFNAFKADAPAVTRKMVEEYKGGSCLLRRPRFQYRRPPRARQRRNHPAL